MENTQAWLCRYFESDLKKAEGGGREDLLLLLRETPDVMKDMILAAMPEALEKLLLESGSDGTARLDNADHTADAILSHLKRVFISETTAT